MKRNSVWDLRVIQRVGFVHALLEKRSKPVKWAAAAQVARGHPVLLPLLDTFYARCTLGCTQASYQPLQGTR